jgi:hypothetical protein
MVKIRKLSLNGDAASGDRRKPPPKALPEGATLEDLIRRRAYELFEARGGSPGDPEDDWLRAEREVRAMYRP